MDHRVESVARYRRRTVCSSKKDRDFQGDFGRRKKEISREEICATIKTLLYVIIYPHAIELFALRMNRCDATKRNEFSRSNDGPPLIESGVAKKIPITIMRLPTLEAMIARSEALKSDLIF